MTQISISGTDKKRFIERTKSALSEFNGSPVKNAKALRFLTTQLGLTNEHTIPGVFTEPSNKNANDLVTSIRALLEQHSESAVMATLNKITSERSPGEHCERCGTKLFPSGFCQDITCPLSDKKPNGEVKPLLLCNIKDDEGVYDHDFDAAEYFLFLKHSGLLMREMDTLFDDAYTRDDIGSYMRQFDDTIGALLTLCESSSSLHPIGFHVTILDPEALKAWYLSTLDEREQATLAMQRNLNRRGFLSHVFSSGVLSITGVRDPIAKEDFDQVFATTEHEDDVDPLTNYLNENGADCEPLKNGTIKVILR